MRREGLERIAVFQREKNKLLAIGMRSAKRICANARIAALQAYGGPGDVASALGTELDEMPSLLTDASIAGHLAGRLQALRTATGEMRKRSKGLGRGPYDAATQFMKARLNLSEERLKPLRKKYQGMAVNVNHTIDELVQKKTHQALSEIVQRGMHVREGMMHLRNRLNTMGIAADNPWLLETAVRSQIHLAYSAGRWNMNQHPDIQEILWGYWYSTAGDERVRPTHEAMEGARYPKDSAFWDANFAPCGFNCRCECIEIFNHDREAVMRELPETVTIDGVEVVPGADKGWDYNPGEVFADML